MVCLKGKAGETGETPAARRKESTRMVCLVPWYIDKPVNPRVSRNVDALSSVCRKVPWPSKSITLLDDWQVGANPIMWDVEMKRNGRNGDGISPIITVTLRIVIGIFRF